MVRAASVISTSGAGASFEARVAATCLSAMLAESGWPGEGHGDIVERVEFQRTAPVSGFDDIHLILRHPTGGARTTYLQVKRTVAARPSDEAFRRPIGDAARALGTGRVGESTFRIVASRSAVSPRDVDRASLAARSSVDGPDFWARWQVPGASSDAERRYTGAVERVVERDLGGADADLAWRVIARMGLSVLDVDQADSQAVARAVDLLQDTLASGERGEALQAFQALCLLAEDAAKVAGGVDRSRLLAELAPRFRLIAAPSARACVARLADEAGAALASIRDDVAGLTLPRSNLTGRVAMSLLGAPGVRLVGEAGSGKSAILSQVAGRRSGEGAGLIVLKHDRLVARTWAAHAQVLQVRTPLARLVDEVATGGSGLLVLDGLDRMAEAGFADLVREVGRAIEGSATAASWRCLAASRDVGASEVTFGVPLLDELRPYPVGGPDSEDLAQLAVAFPDLAPIMARRGYAELNRNLFFIDRMARDPSAAGASSELDLMRVWARRGAAESPHNLTRDATLKGLGEERLVRPHAPLPKVGDEEGFARLASEGTIVVPPYRDVVTFAHDVYEDWAIARALDARRDEVPSILVAAGQPLAWTRAITLVAEIAMEADGPSGWLAYHDSLRGAEDLDPVWRRLTLTAPLHSTRAAGLLDALETVLLDDGGALMADLVETLLTFEVRPNPLILSAPEFDHLGPVARRRLAREAAIPRIVPWHAFLSWSAHRWRNWPKALVPALVRLAHTWLRLTRDEGEPTGGIVAQCVAWSRELDEIDAMPRELWEERSRLRRAMGAGRSGSADPVRDMLRLVISIGAGAAVVEVDAYLEGLVRRGDRDGAEFVEIPGVIPTVLPSRFVDLVVSSMVIEHDKDGPLAFAVDRSDGIRDRSGLFPASPVRAGFDLLFSADEDEALRLLAALGAAAAAAWRRRQRLRGLTPRPLRLAVRGVEAELWGDEHVFKWSRGMLGPHLLGSLLLAADRWLAGGVATGRAVGELCAKLLGSSHLVASAGPCLAAATDRATDTDTLRDVLPLLVEPRLWRYDLRRYLDDRGSAFEIGWRPGDETARRAASELRERRLRQLPVVEGLVVPVHVSGDEALQDDLRSAAAAWRVDDIADFDEQLGNAQARADLDDELDGWRAKADGANWRFSPGPRDGTIAVDYVPPDGQSDRVAEARARHDALEASAPLVEWAFGAARNGVAKSGRTFLDVLATAKELDDPDLFLHALSFDPAWVVRAQGVAAVAAAVAEHGEASLVEREMSWLLSVLARAAAVDHASNPLYIEETVLSEDPAASAARGLGMLAMRGLAGRDAVRTWLGLVASPYRDIAKAGLEPASTHAAANPPACSAALFVCAASMVYAWQSFEESFETRMRACRAERAFAAVEAALGAIDRGEVADLAFPRPVTEPFVAGDAFNPCAGDPETQFDPYRAGDVWSALDLGGVGVDPRLREVLLTYVSGALRWYGSFIGSQSDAHGRHSVTRHVRWEATLGGMAGRLAYLTSDEDAIERLVAPVASVDERDVRGELLAHLLDALGASIIAGDRRVDAGIEVTWRAASRPLFDAARQEAESRHDPDPTPLGAAAFARYGLPAFPPAWPRADELRPLLQNWVDECAPYRFAASIVRSLVARAGGAFVPSPGLDWLEAIIEAHRSTRGEHWRSSLGENAGELLLLLWSGCDRRVRRAHVVRFRAAAARLADQGVPSAAELLKDVASVQAGE